MKLPQANRYVNYRPDFVHESKNSQKFLMSEPPAHILILYYCSFMGIFFSLV